MDADTFYIDYSESSGAGDQYDDSWPSAHDGRAPTRTGFDPREKYGDEYVERDDEWLRRWEWLKQLNEGRWLESDSNQSKREHKDRVRRADARRDAKTFASQLEMTTHQCERVVYLIDNLESLSFGTIPIEGTVLAIISLVANEDDWKIREMPTTTVCVDGDCKDVALFTKIMYDCGVSPQSIRHVRSAVRDEL